MRLEACCPRGQADRAAREAVQQVGREHGPAGPSPVQRISELMWACAQEGHDLQVGGDDVGSGADQYHSIEPPKALERSGDPGNVTPFGQDIASSCTSKVGAGRGDASLPCLQPS